MTDLGTFGGTISEARGINNSGQIIGEFGAPIYTYIHGFIYSNGVVTDIGTLGQSGNSHDSTFVYGLNNRGQVVGRSSDGAFLFSDGVLRNITPDGWLNAWAYGINDSGQIVGYGTNPSGQQDAFLLNPTDTVPEPSSITLIVLGLLFLTGAYHRKQVREG